MLQSNGTINPVKSAQDNRVYNRSGMDLTYQIDIASPGGATPKPTLAPTPTVAPTATPVVTATPKPTVAPTTTPVVTATPKPTVAPTATPVVTSALSDACASAWTAPLSTPNPTLKFLITAETLAISGGL
nr:hypothetical protein [uncultured Deefgea sp.]